MTNDLNQEALNQALAKLEGNANAALRAVVAQSISDYVNLTGGPSSPPSDPLPPDTPDPSKPSEPSEPGNAFRAPFETFKVFDQLVYANKPDDYISMTHEMRITYESAFKLAPGELGPADKAATEAVARSMDAIIPSVVDVEEWWDGDEDISDQGVQNYLNLMRWYKNAAPKGHQAALYSTIPIRNYWNSIRNNESRWHAANERMRSVGRYVDFTCPSLYTFYDNTPNDRIRWVEYARDNVAEARDICPDKPCIPYMWAEMHPGGRGPVDLGFWIDQLDWVRENCDGVVLWSVSSQTRLIDWNTLPQWKDATMVWLRNHFS